MTSRVQEKKLLPITWVTLRRYITFPGVVFLSLKREKKASSLPSGSEGSESGRRKWACAHSQPLPLSSVGASILLSAL